jgi:hypothetical protein
VARRLNERGQDPIRRVLLLVLLSVVGAGASVTVTAPTPHALSTGDEALLDSLQRRTFDFFWERSDARTGLTPDRWPTPSFSSIAAVGFALTAYPIGAERGWVSREQAAERTLTTLRFFWTAPQGPAPAGVAGHKGFFYHFLDMAQGHRYATVELSTIDTALLLAGVLFCQSYFDGAASQEVAIRAYADSLYRRAEWTWMQPNPPLVNHRWRPEDGYSISDWKGYDESMILYVLALGSPSFPIDAAAWPAFTRTYQWRDFHGQAHVNFAPLFGHQYSHVFIDFRGIRDAYMRGRGIDYFENSRRAVLSQRAYAIANSGGWRGYGANIWGLTASDGPLDSTLVIAGRTRAFHSYWARGAAAAQIFDDGTIAPTAAAASLPFAPEIVMPAIRAMREQYGAILYQQYGFLDAFNPTLTVPVPLRHGRIDPSLGWVDTDYLGIDQGPIVAMIENHRSGLVWRVMRRNPYIVRGLQRAGFTGGWLERTP